MSYSENNPDCHSLRDHLAMERTALADQRTFLAYIRTAMTMFVAGVTFIKLLESALMHALGWALIPAGIVTIVLGFMSFRRLKRRMCCVEQGSQSRAAEPT